MAATAVSASSSRTGGTARAGQRSSMSTPVPARGRSLQKDANRWGLYDMLGNVWEWCADHWHESYEGARSDGSAWLDVDAERGARRVFRGGSWFDGARGCRAACRGRFGPGDRVSDLGFRPARGQA